MAIKFNSKELQELDAICRKHGYFVNTIRRFAKADIPNIHIASLGERYYSEIYQVGIDATNAFSAQTISYGAFEIDEYEKFVDASNNILKLLKILNNFDFAKISECDYYYES